MLIALAAAATLAQVRAAPTELRTFLERRGGCAHWAGEEAYDKDRAQEIIRAQQTLRCDRIARDEAALRRRYRKQPDLVELLDGTADWIE